MDLDDFDWDPASSQVDHVPKEQKELRFSKIDTLTFESDFDEWMRGVRLVLLRLQLLALVTKLKRPERGSEGYSRWQFFSASAGEWMYKHCSKPIKNSIQQGKTKSSIFFADELYNRLSKLMEGGYHYDTIAVRCSEFRHYHKTSKESVGEYINEYRKRLLKLRSLEVLMPWLDSTQRLPEELQSDIPQAWYHQEQLKKFKLEDFTEDKFNELCEKIRKSTQRDEGAASSLVPDYGAR